MRGSQTDDPSEGSNRQGQSATPYPSIGEQGAQILDPSELERPPTPCLGSQVVFGSCETLSLPPLVKRSLPGAWQRHGNPLVPFFIQWSALPSRSSPFTALEL